LSGVELDITAVVFTVGEADECEAVWGSQLVEGEASECMPSMPSTDPTAFMFNLKFQTEEDKAVKPTKDGELGQKFTEEEETKHANNQLLWLSFAFGVFTITLIVLTVAYKRRPKHRNGEKQPLLE